MKLQSMCEVMILQKDEIVSGFVQELRRGTLILCVLAKLREPTYGLGLIAALQGTGISIEANTLYPLLRRLEEQGLLTSTWNTEGAKPRKYYEVTEFGKDVLDTMRERWFKTAESMNEILK